MDKFDLPQLVTNTILNMKKNACSELELHEMNLLQTGFPNEDISLDFISLIRDKEVKPKKIIITITVLDIIKPKEFKDMKG